MAPLPPTTTLEDVRDWLRKHADDGVDCPACTQHVKVYRRKITSSMARALFDIYSAGGSVAPIHLPSVLSGQRADEGKLVYWGLIEEEGVRRPDGGRAGYWKMTERGEAFMRGAIRVPKYARVYNGTCLNLDQATWVTIQDALGTKFDYNELMSGV